MLRNVFSSLFVFIVGIAVLPVVALPWIGVGADLQKGMLAALCLGAALIAAGLSVLRMPRRPALSFPWLSYALVPLAAGAVLSAAINGQGLSAFFGRALEMGTVASLCLAAAAALVASLLNRAHTRLFFSLYIAATVLATAATGTMLLFGAKNAALALFVWPHAAFLIVGGIVLAAVLAEGSKGLIRFAYAGAAAFLCIAALFFFHPTPTLIGGAVLAVAAVLQYVYSRASGRVIPLFAPAAAVLLLALSLGGFRGFIELPPDVRLTPYVTTLVGSPVYLGTLAHTLLGSGPGTFGKAWEQRRPAEFNQTELWDTTFAEGYSTVLTWLVTLGFAGAVLYALPALLLIAGLIRTLWGGRAAVHGDGLLVSAAAFTGFVFVCGVFYTLNFPLFLMGAAALGCCARLLSEKTPPVVERALGARVMLCGALLLLGVGLIAMPLRQFAAARANAQGIAAFNENQIPRAEPLLLSAASLWPSSDYLRDASRAALEAVRLKATAPGANDQEVRQGIARARNLAAAAVSADADNFSAHLSEGSLLISLVIAGAEDAGPDASKALARARALSPARPEIPYLQAVLSAQLGSTTLALEQVRESLRLKTDFAPAAELEQRLTAPTQ